ncbi:triose-phosphate isomerase [Flavilitoribacter nigricans]|uniref:Triosephosphate isomerase n=1 Tax=Flavilitoribacter nigricans (strain ATCC 23147 / DSM 23189 / NBRC 102662 / NCIMB 1420 / SS-2) TaxID=1122177 RepID=A0A2D0N2W3_FLAN2|nr:triose-phosphate isomerase [Flavilitoribacter nigricans]PHN02882.1 triose-phosphate isomerase [Flavilitoribacter nigricans DSM 23189 = NBRC 102662]
MKRQQIVAGNWKMNKDLAEGKDLAKAVAAQKSASDVVLILGTPFIHLSAVSEIIDGTDNLHLSAQNCHQEESGAYTGEISASMLKSVGAEYVILGHSERREYFGEDEALLAKKVDIALAHGLIPIFCCGEKLDVREAENHVALVKEQLSGSVFHLSADAFGKIVIAYEPVWAIGTGRTASPEQAQEMHAAIREMISEQYGAEVAEATSILYGGSCKPGNAKEIFSQPDVDGGLIGGASLKAEDFVAIANSF